MRKSFLKLCSKLNKEEKLTKIPKKRGFGKVLLFSTAVISGSIYALDYYRVFNVRQIFQYYKIKRDEEQVEKDIQWKVMKAVKSKELKKDSLPTAVLKMLDVKLWCRSLLEAFFLALRSLQLAYIFSPLLLTLKKAIADRKYREIWSANLFIIEMFAFSLKPKRYEKFVKSLERAGPCFIKFGQWAATRPDLFPPDLCNSLSRLQNETEPHSFQYTLSVLKDSYAIPLEEVFESFDNEPIGSGCIAQVYRAKLRNQYGDEEDLQVAVKVLHPNITGRIERDLDIIRLAVKMVSSLPTVKWLSLNETFAQFSKTMRDQLDMRVEADNLQRFINNFKDRREGVVFPRPVKRLSNQSVLVETFMHGTPLKKFVENADPTLKSVVAKKGMRAFLQMMLVDNFVHADMHGGNVMVRIDGKIDPNSFAYKRQLEDNVKLVLLDVGLVSTLQERERHNFKALFDCLRRGDGKQGARLIMEGAAESHCDNPAACEPFISIILEYKFLYPRFSVQEEMQEVFDLVKNSHLSQIPLGLAFTKVLDIVRRHKVRLEYQYSTLIVSIMVIEGIGRQLSPNLSLFSTDFIDLFLAARRDNVI